MYRASDEVENEEWLATLEGGADRLNLPSETRTRAADLFLSTVPEADRSKQPALAAAVYVASLATGEARSQQDVADAFDVSRLSVQGRWKALMREAGLEPPSW
ncbi:transcription initiation factor IIB family protein [Halosegnis sp.]|uniref:transcription initiation factor IIB family protein n=1 Tax=Halosegnis sp. TaxID=2864959 RepID=UPI0035D41C8D